MRLDKYLSQATGLSRSQVRRRIKAGEVSVAGDIIKNAAFIVSEQADISLEGERIAAPQARYFMLHKPADTVCANKDRDHATVIDLLWQEPRAEKLQIVGRLDADSTGLVLLTDDGQWNHKITSPRHATPKVYRVQLAEPLAAQQAEQLRQGVWLRQEKQRTLPAQLEAINECVIRLTITEGRYHQVKRMLAAVGNHVTALHREKIGAICLDAGLQPGEYRPLSNSEVESV